MASQLKCPVCESHDNVRIAYGMPNPDLFEAAEAGTVALGGCMVTEDDPTRACKVCGTRFWPDGRHVAGDSDEGWTGTPPASTRLSP